MTLPPPEQAGQDTTIQGQATEPDAPARPAAKPVPKKQYPVSNTREETGEGPAPLTEGTEVGGHTLARLIALRPFMTYFCWLAHKQNPAAHRPETRVNSLRTLNPKFYWMCVMLDMVITLVAVVLLVAAAAAVLYKTIWL